MTLPAWTRDLTPHIGAYLDRLCVPEQVGRYRPATAGLTPEGERVTLGFSCYAHKIVYMLGLWDTLPEADRAAWNAYLLSFQVHGNPLKDWAARNAFVDPVVADTLVRQEPRLSWRERLHARRHPSWELNHFRRTMIAETKQAVATLAQVGVPTHHPYDAFPQQPNDVQIYLAALDWAQPWGAGAQLATLSVFFRTEAPRLLPAADVTALVSTACGFVDEVLDAETGAYFLGETPDHGNLINGAMKVLTALDWLEVPVHQPERLIDTCLAQPPRSEGCHLVDAVYVLYRCAQQTEHRRDDIRTYCTQLLNMIERHYVPQEGGFSYNVGASQTVYYGVTITRGEPVADIHGTILLTWALTMIFELLGANPDGWRVIRP
ncbi:hypothetical protein [Aggregatilinea lenta]|uniref:hypothetical protein n=1 Tax=Aggregatilinea lenta TaxID=913108 RepID=UPI000E5B77BC|nr:hypothetical protein [Aggregatilinea lenta]